MKKIILIHVFSFIALSATCQMMEAEGSSIQGKPAEPKAATTVVTGKAYAGYVAPATQQKQVSTQPAKPIEKPIVLPAGGNIGNTATTQQVNQNAKVEANKTEGSSLDLKAIPKQENQKATPVEMVKPVTTIKKG